MLRKWWVEHGVKLGTIGIGVSAYEALNFIYDGIFYPFAVVYWGIWKGGAIALAGSLIICAVLFWLYDKMRIDWLGAHALRELDERHNKNTFDHVATWIGKKNKTLYEKVASVILFIVLTLPIDPLIVAVHYRQKHFGGIKAKDWGILFMAVLLANLWWLLQIGVVLEVIKWIVSHWSMCFFAC